MPAGRFAPGHCGACGCGPSCAACPSRSFPPPPIYLDMTGGPMGSTTITLTAFQPCIWSGNQIASGKCQAGSVDFSVSPATLFITYRSSLSTPGVCVGPNVQGYATLISEDCTNFEWNYGPGTGPLFVLGYTGFRVHL